jgi:hypothetical protein
MPGRKNKPKPKTSKRPADITRVAAAIVAEAARDPLVEPKPDPTVSPEKNVATFALRRRGRLDGGRARADSLSPPSGRRP